VVDFDRAVAICVVMGFGAFLVFASHFVTMWAVSGELEAWRALGHDLTATAEECVALLPTAWDTETALRIKDATP